LRDSGCTGRSTGGAAGALLAGGGNDAHLVLVTQVLLPRDDHVLAGLYAGANLGPSVIAEAEVDRLHRRHLVGHGEDERLVVAQHDRLAWHDRHVFTPLERDRQLCEHARLEATVLIFGLHLDGEGAAARIGARKDAGHDAFELLARKGVDGERGWRVLLELGDVRLLDVEHDLRLARDERHERRVGRHDGALRHRAVRDDAVERRADERLGEVGLLNQQRGLLLLDRRLRLRHRRLGPLAVGISELVFA